MIPLGGDPLSEVIHRLRDLRGVASGIAGEERIDDDPESQRVHLRANVNLSTILPRLLVAFRTADHAFSEARDSGMVKGRLHEATLAFPNVAAAGEQPVAERGAQHAGDERRLIE